MTDLTPSANRSFIGQPMSNSSDFTVVSINIGPRVEVEIFSRPTLTAFEKHSVSRAVDIDQLGIVGDGHYGREEQEGLDHAVQICCMENHAFWSNRLSKVLEPGAFGEAVTYQGPDERSLRLGDVFKIGPTRLQITSPRLPCAKLAHFLGQELSFVKMYHQSLRTGIYARVLDGGKIEVGDRMAIDLTDPMLPTVAEAAAMLLDKVADAEMLERLANDVRVSIMLRTMFAKKAQAIKARQSK